MQKYVKIFQDTSYTALDAAVNAKLKELEVNGVDDTWIKLHLATDVNTNTVMIEWIENRDEGD